jgi:hypothetical protein
VFLVEDTGFMMGYAHPSKECFHLSVRFVVSEFEGKENKFTHVITNKKIGNI